MPSRIVISTPIPPTTSAKYGNFSPVKNGINAAATIATTLMPLNIPFADRLLRSYQLIWSSSRLKIGSPEGTLVFASVIGEPEDSTAKQQTAWFLSHSAVLAQGFLLTNPSRSRILGDAVKTQFQAGNPCPN